MGLSINTNVPGLQIGRQANETSNLLLENLRQLSTAQRINRAADDAAGLALAEQFDAAIRQNQAEIANLQSAVNVTQTADGALASQQDALGRLEELALQAANGTLNDDQRAALNAEAQQIVQEIDDIAQNTQFNGQNLIDQNRNINVGTSSDLQINLDESTAGSLGVDTIDIGAAAGAEAALNQIGSAQQALDQNRAGVGAQANRFDAAIDQRETETLNQQESESLLRDLDVARATTELTQNQLLLQAGLGAAAQSNITPQTAAQLLQG